MDFLTKELVETYFYTDCNQDRNDSKEVFINGRPYIKFGTRTATTIVANLYKVWDSSVKLYKYVAMLGIARQHPCDVKIDREEGIEIANVNANIEPFATINFDHQVQYYEILPLLKAYANTLEVQFVKTRQEMIAEGKQLELATKKYRR